MADLLQDLLDYITVAGVSLGDGSFKDFMPDTPANVVAIFEYPGVAGNTGIDTQVRSVQINVRNIDYVEAKRVANEIYALLHQSLNPIIQLTTVRWVISSPRQSPFLSNRDVKGRVTFTFNVGFTTYPD